MAEKELEKSIWMETSDDWGSEDRIRGLIGKYIQGGSNMTGTDLCVNKPHCAAAVRP